MTTSTNYQNQEKEFFPVMGIQGKLDELNEMKYRSSQGGGIKRIESQHIKGKLTARERISLLVDPGTFEEVGALVISEVSSGMPDQERFLGDSVVTGYGNINEEKVFIYSQDFTVVGGTISEVSAKKICRIMDMAANCGCPIVGLLDSGGARIQEGVSSLAGCGEIFSRNTRYSGVIPQISVILGPCAGAASYSPALTDFIFMVDGMGQMYITGPEVVRTSTGENVTAEESGGARVNAHKSGNCHFICETEEQCLGKVRRLLHFLPQNNRRPAKRGMCVENSSPDELLNLVPADPNKAYDMRKIILNIIDNGDFMEVQRYFARSIIIGFARIDGKTVGIVAQQPMYSAGALTVDASDKAARFIRFCDCFSIPLITLVDVPGYLPGLEQEHNGIVRHGAKLLYAYAEATTGKISVVIRKAYGGAYIAMSSKPLKGDINYAWPASEFAVMGPEGAVNILYRHTVAHALNPEQAMQDLANEYRTKFSNPYIAAARGYIDDVIDPRETRVKLASALALLENKGDTLPWKKHGNIPL